MRFVGAGLERGSCACDGVFQTGVLWREYPLRGAGLASQAVAAEGLTKPAVAMTSGFSVDGGARRLVLRRNTPTVNAARAGRT